jgi:Protein of unknown function (DUF1488)
MRMALQFPNVSRSYNAQRRCVNFRGYDEVFEVAFELDWSALKALAADLADGEAPTLTVFDANRPRIEQVAKKVYARQKRNGTHVLGMSDF